MIKTENAQSPFTVTFEHTIPVDRIKCLLVSAMEGGINYWAVIARYEYADGISKEDFKKGGCFQEEGNYYHPSEIIPFVKGCAVILGDTYESEEKGEKVCYKLDLDAIHRGLKVMAEKYPHHMRDFLDENDDAITGDVFVQCCVMGEIVYG